MARLFVFCFLSVSLLSFTNPARATENSTATQFDDVTWTGGGDGTSWSDGANWSTGEVPGPTDHVIITKAGDYVVSWWTNGSTASVGSITLGGSSGTQTLALANGPRIFTGAFTIGSNGNVTSTTSLTVPGGITNDGAFEWEFGTLTGNFLNNGLLTSSGGTIDLNGTLDNQGSVQLTNAYLTVRANGFLDNSGILDLYYTTGAYFRAVGAIAPVSIVSDGTVTKTGAGHFRFLSTTSIGGTLTVEDGRVSFEDDVIFGEGLTLTIAADAIAEVISGDLTLPSTLQHTGGGAFEVDNSGNTINVAPGGSAIDFAEPGFVWEGGTIAGGVLTNVGIVRLVGYSSPGANGASAGFTNDGLVTGGTASGSFVLSGGAVFRNNADVILEQTTSFRTGGNGGGLFLNADGALFSANFGASFFSTNGPLTLDLMGTVEFKGTVSNEYANTIMMNAARWEIAGKDSVGSIGWFSGFEMGPDATMAIDIAESGNDQFSDWFYPTLDGTLDVRVADGFQLVDGQVFTIAVGNGAVQGDFHNRESLTVESQGKSLFPSASPQYKLTVYDGIQTLNGTLATDPSRGTSGETVLLELEGEGFSPDMTATLECDGCEDPIESATIPGLFRSIAPGIASVRFDLSDGSDVLGTYKIVLTDPRGGQAETAFTVNEPEPTVTITAVDADASEQLRDRGLVLVTTDRPVRSPLSIPFSMSGTAKMYSDYLTDVQGQVLDIPRGEDSVYVSIVPLTDDQAEATETAVLTLNYPGPVAGLNSATVSIADGPASADFALFGFSPERGGNCDLVTIEVYGQGFSETNTVTLTGIGDPIQSVSQYVDETGTVLTATFLMDGQPTGERTVRVHNGSEELSATGKFTVEEATYPAVFVQVLAPPFAALNRSVAYTVLLRNRSNVDVTGYVSFAATTIDEGWTLDKREFEFAADPDAEWLEILPSYEVDGWTVMGLPLVTLRAGETRRVRIDSMARANHEVLASWSYVW